MAEVLSWVSDAVLRAEYDADTLRRARDYVADGRVGPVNIFEQGRLGARVLASVRGTASRAYSVLLTVTAEEPPSWSDAPVGEVDVWSRCSCPVGDQCKHGAALAMVAAGAARERADRAWESRLADVLSDLERPGPSATPKRLALRLDVRPPSAHRWGRLDNGVTLRLVQQGARGRWVKSGISWGGLPYALTRGSHDIDHLTALRSLHAGLLSSGGYHAAAEEPYLGDFGPLLWPALAEAVAAGVPLVGSERVAGVSLSADPAEVLADVVATPGGARLTVEVQHDGQRWSGPRVQLVGEPVSGVVLLDGDPPALDVVLAPLTASVPASLGDLLTTDDPVLLPDHGRDRWQRVLLPRLGRSLRLQSSDDSVDVRPLPAPRLRLTVDWSDATTAALTWTWVYGDDPAALACPIDSGADLDGLRDPAAEATALRRLTTSPVWPWRPIAHDKVTGAAVLRLALELLPGLRDSGLADVVEVDRPDFRAAQGDIEIRFDTTPGPRDQTADQAGDQTGDQHGDQHGAGAPPGPDDEQPDPGPTDWLDLWVMVRIDGEQVPLPEVLAALTRGEEQLVLPTGLFVPTSRPELAALVDLVRAAAEIHETERADRVRLGRDDLGAWAQVGDTGSVDESVAAWVDRARALRDLVALPTPEPTGVVSTLRDYQRQGFHWLAFLWQSGLGGVLADDMGLGKTLQVLSLISHARAQASADPDPAPFLVVAPTSVVGAWQGEADRHTPHLRVQAITSAHRRRGGVRVRDLAAGADVVVTTYTLLRLEADQYAEVAWAGLVLDEAQQVKNHTGKTHQAVRRVSAPFRLAVTGTPFENRLMELWSLLSITNPGLYPTAQVFGRQVVRPVEKDRDPDALRRFRARVKPFVLRRTKELVAPDLPPKQEQVLEVALSPRHRRLYDTHLQRERQKILGLMTDFDQNRIAIFSALTRLRQLALDPVLVDPAHDQIGSAKLDLVVEHLSEVVTEGHSALVFSQFTGFLGLVRERLEREGHRLCYLDGSTRDRAAEIARFRSGSAPVFLISLKAGGTGLTLTEADYVYVLDPWWNPAAEAQAVDRAHRIGQERPVLVYRLVSSGTIEEKVMALKERKAALFAQVVDGDGLLGQAITADDVRALVED